MRFSWQALLLAHASLVTLVLLSVSARAQGNALSAPTGGRSALMGNTGVALARDGSAPFINPATIVRINDNSLAFSVNFFTFTETSFPGWHQPAPGDASHFGSVGLDKTSINTSGFRVLPSTLCLFFTIRGVTAEGSNDGGLHRGRQKLSLCFGSTEFDDVTLPALGYSGTTSVGATTQAQSLVRSWNRFQAGPSYSISLTDAFAVGASLHGIYTAGNYVIDSSSITAAQGGGSVQSSLDASSWARSFDVAAILGAVYHVGHVSLGASVEVPTLHIFGNYKGSLSTEYGLSGTDNASIMNGSGSFSAPTPMRLSAGAGAEWQRLVVELDETYQQPVGAIRASVNGSTTTLTGTTSSIAPFSSIYSVEQHPTLNTSLGAEYFVSHSFSLIGGASTSLTTLPGLSPTMSVGNLVQARTSTATISLGIGSYGGGSDILIGAQLGYGWGQSLAVNPYVLPNDWVVIDTHTWNGMLIVAGATDLRSITRAVEKVENAVTTGNPELAPADPKHPFKNPVQPSRELPRSGTSDPRNDTPLPPTPAPPRATVLPSTDAGAPQPSGGGATPLPDGGAPLRN